MTLRGTFVFVARTFAILFCSTAAVGLQAEELPRMIEISWSLGPDLPQGFQDSDGGMIDRTLITAGGFAAGQTIPGMVYPRGFVHETWGLDLTNPQADWVSLPDFPGSNDPSNVDGAGRQELAAVVVNNEIYAWGGFNYTAPYAYADGYRLSHAGGVWVWDQLPSLPFPVSSPGITAIGDTIYSVGGADYDSTAFYTNTDRNGNTPRLGAKFYRLDTDNLAAGWTELPELPGTPRWVHATATVGDQLYVFGGATGDEAATTFPYRSVVDNWRFDTTTGTWHRLADLPVSSGNFSNGQVVVDDRYILLIGGFQYDEVRNPDGTVRPAYGEATKTIPGNVYFSDIWVYDTLTDQFGTATPLPNNNNLPMAVVDGHQLYLLGGETGGFTFDGQLFGHHPESVFIGAMEVVFDGAVRLQVDQLTGAARMINVSDEPLSLDGYSILSQQGSLDPSDGAWRSLQDAGVPGWFEIGTPTENLLTELNPLGHSTLAPGESFDLGTPYTNRPTAFGQAPPDGDLSLEFSPLEGGVTSGLVEYIGRNNLVLTVDPDSGESVLENQSTFDVAIDGYELRSESGSLRPDQWDSFSDHPDIDGWVEIPGASSELLAEFNPLGSTRLESGDSIALGALFGTLGSEDLTFEFSIFGGPIMSAIVQFASLSVPFEADFDRDGDVDGDDFLVWQAGFGLNADGDADGDGDTDGDDFLIWQAEFGSADGSGASHSIPEPGSSTLAILCIAFACAVLSGHEGRRLSEYSQGAALKA